MNPKKFLMLGGAALTLVGVLGLAGVISWFSGSENWVHLVLGVVSMMASAVLGAGNQRLLAKIIGCVGILMGLYGLLSLFGVGDQNLWGALVRLAVGLWAWMASRGSKAPMGMPMPQ